SRRSGHGRIAGLNDNCCSFQATSLQLHAFARKIVTARRAVPPVVVGRSSMFINWDVTARFDPNSLVDSTQSISMHGIPIPTYGNYGGPNYTAGVEGGTTPGGPNPIPAPRDDLDKLFWQHDLAYQQVKDGLVPPNDIPDAVAKADVTLVEGLYDLITKTNLAPEAFLYDALATLTIGAKILTTPSELAYLKANPMDAGVVLPAI